MVVPKGVKDEVGTGSESNQPSSWNSHRTTPGCCTLCKDVCLTPASCPAPLAFNLYARELDCSSGRHAESRKRRNGHSVMLDDDR